MSLQAETFEALCSALYQMPFTEFLGEQDIDTGRIAWFHLGDSPQDIRVSILRSKPGKSENVRVRMEWRTVDRRKGEQTLDILTYEATQATLRSATEQMVLRILEVLQDVQRGTGVAAAGNTSDTENAE